MAELPFSRFCAGRKGDGTMRNVVRTWVPVGVVLVLAGGCSLPFDRVPFADDVGASHEDGDAGTDARPSDVDGDAGTDARPSDEGDDGGTDEGADASLSCRVASTVTLADVARSSGWSVQSALAASDTSFLAVWYDGANNVLARVIDTAGSMGTEQVVAVRPAPYDSLGAWYPAASAVDGGWAACWRSAGTIECQKLAGDATTVGTPTTVTGYPDSALSGLRSAPRNRLGTRGWPVDDRGFHIRRCHSGPPACVGGLAVRRQLGIRRRPVSGAPTARNRRGSCRASGCAAPREPGKQFDLRAVRDQRGRVLCLLGATVFTYRSRLPCQFRRQCCKMLGQFSG
jgi:hypothetical protein